MYYNEQSYVFHNGKYLKPKDAMVDLYGQSLHYGNGVFEGIRAYKTQDGTKLFKPEEHFDRLLKGASAMSMNFNFTAKELTEITYQLLDKNKLQDAYVRPLVTTGPDMSLKTSSEVNLTIQCWQWGKYMGDKLLKVKTSKFQRPNPKSCNVETKITGHYVNSILSTNEAKSSGYDEALLLDMNENVAESSGANIFMEKDGKLVTPPKGHIMPGITRSTVFELCKNAGYLVEERHFTLKELKQADSAFFTGTAAEIVGLQSLDEYVFPMDWNQSLGSKLMKLYKGEVLGIRHKKILVTK